MPRGTVKLYYPEKGYGFITPEHGGEIVFVHESEVCIPGVTHLQSGQIVEYDTTRGDAYLLATNVRDASD
ncbi:cold-shock protein [Pandoraea anapnoica]|uniref:Cold-shock protein n=1 Tax=Pandoraea anapnoica TaxID=2508301 RepID=A0A5E5AC85_9BURK|nr:cold shock domain-containing protein [Pandoraea anapnoica]VVE70788.1 cold-shock protein [Pandoraea anapnoica]